MSDYIPHEIKGTPIHKDDVCIYLADLREHRAYGVLWKFTPDMKFNTEARLVMVFAPLADFMDGVPVYNYRLLDIYGGGSRHRLGYYTPGDN